MTKFARVCNRAVLTLLILALLLTPFAFGGVNQTKALLENTFLSPILFYSNYFARLAIALAVMLWLVNVIVAKEIKFARTPLDIPIGLFLAYTFLWFIFSKSKFLTGGRLGDIFCYAALYYLVVNNVKTRLRMNMVAGALIFSGFVMATTGLIQCSGYFVSASGLKHDYAINLLRPRQYWGRVGGTFVCPNHFAGYLEMIIPFALGYVLFSKIPSGRKILMAFCGLVMITGLLFSLSRGGWAGFAVSGAFLFVMATREKKVPVAAWLVPLAVIFVGAAAVLAKSVPVQERLAHSFTTEDASYLKRAHVWLDTASLVRDHLLVGTGPGTFELAYREYRRPSILLAIKYTHNDYLHILSDYGAVGFVILLFGIVAFGRKMWRATNKLKRRTDKALAYGVLAAVIALLVHSLVDFNMHIPSNAMTMAVIVGLGMSIRQYRLSLDDEWVALSGRKPRLFPVTLQYGLISVVVLATAGVLYMNFRAYASSLALHKAMEKDPSFWEFGDQAAGEKEMEAAKQLYQKSAFLFPSNSRPWASIANMYLRKAAVSLAKGEEQAKGKEEMYLWKHAENLLAKEGLRNRFYLLLLGGKEARQDYEEAMAAIKEAIRRNPLDPRYYLTLAKAYAGIAYINDQYKQGLPAQYSPSLEKYVGMAEAEFQKALEMDPNNADYHDQVSLFYSNTGRYDEAERELRLAIEIFPDDPTYWEQRKYLHERLGLLYDRTSRYDEAEREFQKAIELLPAKAYFQERKRLQKVLEEIRQRREETKKPISAF